MQDCSRHSDPIDRTPPDRSYPRRAVSESERRKSLKGTQRRKPLKGSRTANLSTWPKFALDGPEASRCRVYLGLTVEIQSEIDIEFESLSIESIHEHRGK